MARKGENIYKRKDGRWEGRYIKGRKPDGSIRYGSIYGLTYGEVKEKLLPLKLLYGRSHHKKRFHGLFCHYLLRWLHETKDSVRDSTYGNYHRIVHLHLLPALGEKPLHLMTKEDIKSFIKTLEKKKLSLGTIQNIFRLLSMIIGKAAKRGDIEEDICRDVVLPRRKNKKKVPVLTRNEQKALEQEALRQDGGALVLLALYTGMRIGEICALRWEDVDLDEGTIYVSRTVQRMSLYGDTKKTAVCFGPPKSSSSERVITLPENLIEYLKSSKTRARSEFVVECKGGFTEPRTCQYRFYIMLKKAGVRHVNFHALRHTFATRCIELRMDVTTLSQILGHASVKMTLDIYTDSIIEHKRSAMRALDSLGQLGLETVA